MPNRQRAAFICIHYTAKISVYRRIFCGEFSVFNGTGSVGPYAFVSVSRRNNVKVMENWPRIMGGHTDIFYSVFELQR